MEQTTGEAKLKLYLLGRFAVEYDGAPIASTAWRRRRPVDLLTSLALAPGHVLHREELIDRLWPNKDLDAGANNLYRTLHDLRKITGDDAVCVERGAVRLHETAWVDVGAFESAVSAGTCDRLREAVALYSGDLLPDDPYSDAIEQRRVGLRQRFVDAVLKLARSAEVEAHDRIGALRRLLEVDPCIEEAHRLLMRALAEADRPKHAIGQYKVCVEALREHLDTGPSAATQELLRRIKAGELRPGRADAVADDNWSHVARRLLGTDEPRDIRGRSAAREQARAFAESERGTMVILGDAGAGKTRMAVDCARMCADRGAVILAGLGCDFEGAAPYTPFVDAWTDVLRVKPDATNPFLAFEPSSGSAQEDRVRLFRAVEQSLVELAGDGTACVLIEDIHQADESSLLLFHHLVRASRHLPIHLIGTLREEEIRAGNALQVLLASLDRERQTTHLSLDRLDRDATRELIEDVWGEAPPDHAVDTAFRLAAGNPFYTEEVAHILRDADGAFAPSSDLMQSIRARIARLGADAERLLLAACVQGARFEFDVAHRAAGMELEAALDALDVAVAARVVEEHQRRYRFRHALIREALCQSLGRARATYLHRATAAALESQPEAEPELLAFHHHAAGNFEQALPHTLAAIANARARLGFGEAIAHSERALELMQSLGHPADETMFEVIHGMGAMRVALGDLDAAVDDLDRAAGLSRRDGWTPSPVQRCSAKRLAGLALIEAGVLDEAEKRLDDALATLGAVEDGHELCNIYYLHSQLRWHQNRYDEAFELAERCLAVAEKAGDLQAIAKGYEMLALACHSLGEWKQGRGYEERREEVAGGTLDVASAFDVHL